MLFGSSLQLAIGECLACIPNYDAASAQGSTIAYEYDKWMIGAMSNANL